jgi:hypothetical protein
MKSIYLIKNTTPGRGDSCSSCIASKGWNHTYITSLLKRGDVVLGRIDLAKHGESGLRIRNVDGDLVGKAPIQNFDGEAEHLITLALIADEAIPVNVVDGKLIELKFGHAASQGGIWCPQSEMDRYAELYKARALAIAAKNNLAGANWVDGHPSHKGAKCLVELNHFRYVVQWGMDEGGAFEHCTPVENYNETVTEFNQM